MTKFVFTFCNSQGEDIAIKVKEDVEDVLDAFGELSEEQKSAFREAVIFTAQKFFEVDTDEIERLKEDTIYEIFHYEDMVQDGEENGNKDEELEREFPPLLIIKEVEEEDEDCNVESADFYAVQECVDGFGYDTATRAIFKTKEEAIEYTKDWNCEYKIVPQRWGEYENYYN